MSQAKRSKVSDRAKESVTRVLQNVGDSFAAMNKGAEWLERQQQAEAAREAAYKDAVILLASQAAHADRKPDSSNRPSDLMRAAAVVAKYGVSRSTLARARREGRFTGYRRPGARPNTPFEYSEAELSRRYEPRQQPR